MAISDCDIKGSAVNSLNTGGLLEILVNYK